MKRVAERLVGGLCIIIFATLVLDILWGVATRYLLGNQAHWTEELARVLLVWLAMLGAALAYIERSHLGIDALTRLLDPAARRIADILTHSFVFFFAAAVLVYGGVELFLDRWESGQVLSALQVRKAWFYLSLPVSGLLIALVAMERLFEASRRRRPIDSPEAR